MNNIKKNQPEKNEEELEIIEYGLEALYLTFTKIIIILLLSIVLDISLMHVFYKMFNIEPILSKIIANIIILFMNFVVIKFIFRKEEG